MAPGPWRRVTRPLATALLVCGMALTPSPSRGAGRPQAPRITDTALLERVFQYQADFQRQRQIQASLEAYAQHHDGRWLPLEPETWRRQLEQLAEAELLSDSSGPPSGQGEYLTDRYGWVSSTVFGSPQDPQDEAAALASSGAFVPDPVTIADAVSNGHPESFWLGVPHLTDSQLEPMLGLLGIGLLRTDHPRARRTVLDLLRRRSSAGVHTLPQFLAKALLKIARDPAAAWDQRFEAMAALQFGGYASAVRVPREKLDDLMDRAWEEPRLRAAVPAALDALGDDAVPYLLSRLRSGPEVDPGRRFALFALRHYAGERVVEALVGYLMDANPDLPERQQCFETLKHLTGEDLGHDKTAWVAWFRETYRRAPRRFQRAPTPDSASTGNTR